MKYRVSNVEAFRKWEADEEAELADLIDDITGDSQPSPLMLAGTAFHKVLETSVSGVELESAEADGHRFVFAEGLEIEVTPIRELRASKTYIVDGETIVISGQVDAIDGLRIEDHKTTGRFDADRYLAGYQWRLYLDIFGANHFRWNIFEITEVDSTAETFAFDVPPIEFKVSAQHRLEQYRYPTLEADCTALVTRFARFVRTYVEQVA